MPAALRLEDLVARLPGVVRRGHVPAVRGEEGACLATGIEALDRALGGGVPRGRLSELGGRGSAGTTSLAQRLAAGVTRRGDLVAWVDGADAFDPESAQAAGIALERVLWVRPPEVAVALAAAELVLSLGGFPLVVLDVGATRLAWQRSSAVALALTGAAGALPAALRRSGERGLRLAMAPQTWIRLARAAARSHAALVALRGAGAAGPAAAIRLELAPARVLWDRAAGAPPLLDGLVARVSVKRNRGLPGEREVRIPLGWGPARAIEADSQARARAGS